jgi:hypothetical protein
VERNLLIQIRTEYIEEEKNTRAHPSVLGRHQQMSLSRRKKNLWKEEDRQEDIEVKKVKYIEQKKEAKLKAIPYGPQGIKI